MITKKCKNCGNEFDTYPSDNKKFCSKGCFYDSKRIEKECPNCGDIFKTAQSNDYTFCSNGCYQEYYDTTITCLNCDKEVHVKKCRQNEQKFCNERCWKEYYRDNHRLEKTCNHCGNNYEVNKSSAEISNYCSKECANEGQKKGKYFNCEECGNSFYEKPSNFNRRNVRFCSKECYNKGRKLYPKTEDLRAKIRARRNGIIERVSKNTGIPESNIPEALIEAKYQQLKLREKIQNHG